MIKHRSVIFCRADILSQNFISDRVHLQFMFYGQNKDPHPFNVKSRWELPIQPWVALETYLEESKILITGLKIFKPKTDFPRGERQAIN